MQIFQRLARWGYRRFLSAPVRWLFFHDLIAQTNNFSSAKWLGQPIWQNVLDLWVIQETISEIKPALLIECGTNRGGSSLFYAHLFDLIGQGQVVTVDVEKMHDLSHPRITYLIGSSTSPGTVAAIRALVERATGPVMVVLDSDHHEEHVRAELECYAPLVTPGSYCLVQDGVIDSLFIFRQDRPGPVPAIVRFLQDHPEFTVDDERSKRFLITHHPKGWLRRTSRGGVGFSDPGAVGRDAGAVRAPAASPERADGLVRAE